MELAAHHEEIVQSKRDLTLENLKSINDMSEELYRLIAFFYDEKFTYFHPKEEQKKMEHLLW